MYSVVHYLIKIIHSNDSQYNIEHLNNIYYLFIYYYTIQYTVM